MATHRRPGPVQGLVLPAFRRLCGRAFRRRPRAPAERRTLRLEHLEDRTAPSVSPLGTEFQVNTYTKNAQQTSYLAPHPVAMDAAGNSVVTWASQGQDGDGWGVYAQRYDSQGNRLGPEFQVNTTTTNDQEYPSVAMDANGDFVVTWAGHQSGHWNVYARQYASDGTALGPEFLVNTSTTGDNLYPDVGTDAGGDFIVVWQGNQAGNWDVYARSFNFNGNGQGPEYRINATTAGDQEFPSIAMDAGGRAVVTWSSQGQDGSGWGVYAQRLNAGGSPTGGEFQVNTTTADDQEYSRVALDASDNFVITWSSHNQDGNGWGVYAQRYTWSAAQGGEFRVNTTVANDQEYSTVAMQPGGNFLVTWSSHEQDGSGWGVYGQTYNASGAATGNEFRVNTTTANDQEYSGVALNPGGTAVVVWSSQNQDGDNWGVFGQRYQLSAAGVTVTPTTGLVTTESGGTATFSVALATQPTADVTIGVSSSDTAAGTVSTPQLVFTPSDWNVAQVVKVTGQDDQVVTPDTPYTVLLAPTVSADAGYNGLDPPAVSLTNRETDVAGFQVTPTSGLVTTESGGTATFSVALSSKPTAAVTVGVSSTDTVSGGTVSVSSLTFTPADWNVAQVVTVTGVDDHVVTGNTAYSVLLSPAVSTDPVYSGLTPPAVSLTNQETDVAGVVVTPTSGLVTSEAGGTATFTVVLTSQPTAAVTIPLTSSNPLEGTVGTPLLTFTPADWNVAQTVTVTGFDDLLPDSGGTPYQIITGPAASTDLNYAGYKPADVSLVNQEVPTPGITVTPTSGLVTTEAGGSATFTVVLNSQPTANVSVGLHSSDTAAGVLSTPGLTFTPSDWNVPQTVTITGVDDQVVTGNVPYTIVTDPAVSTDLGYAGLNPADVSVTNLEADTAGIVVKAAAGLTTTQAGGTASFSVVLTSQPTADVTVPLTSSDTVAGGTVSVSSLTFTPADWNVPQVVTVTGANDQIAQGNVSYAVLLGAAVSADPVYAGMTGPGVSLVNLGTVTAGVTITPTSGLVTTESGGTATFRVALNSKPTAAVTIALGSSNPSAGVPSTGLLTFNSANWNVPQAVTVTGVDDHIVTGNVSYSILTGPVSSADPGYSGLVLPAVSLVNQETDVAGVLVTPRSGLVTTESGGTATFSVSLTSEPTAAVSVGVSSSDTTAGIVSASDLTFTPADWNVAQIVTVTGADDGVVTPNRPYTVVLSAAASADLHYNGLPVTSVALINLETDTPPPPPAPAPAPPPAGRPVTTGPTPGGQRIPAPGTATGATGGGTTPTPTTSPNTSNPALVQYTLRAGAGATPPSGGGTAAAGPSGPASSVTSALATLIALGTGGGSGPAGPQAGGGGGVEVAHHAGAAQAAPAATAKAGPPADQAGLVSAAKSGPADGIDAAAVRLTGPASSPVLDPFTVTGPPPSGGAGAPAPGGRSVTAVGIPDASADQLTESLEEYSRTQRKADIAFAAGIVTSVGYVLFGGRGVSWLLSALTARPLWKQFDPLDVLFAWEKEKERRRALGLLDEDEEEEETLQSLVAAESRPG